MRILFKNADILVRENDEYKLLENAYLGTDGKAVDWLSKEAPAAKYDETKDMSGKLLMPGLVNAHGHSPMTILRGIGTDLPLNEWLFGEIVPREDKFVPDNMRVGTNAAVIESLATGTTMIMEMYDFPWAEAPAAGETGIKMVIGRSCLHINYRDRIDQLIELYRNYNNSYDGRITVNMPIHSEYMNNEESLRAFSETAAEYRFPVSIHISETRSEHEECIERWGMTPTAVFEKFGFLENGGVFSHCIYCTDEDFDIMRERGISLAHCPVSNLKLADGIARIPAAVAKGINVCLGTDGVASNNNLNLFEELKLAAILHKGTTLDPTVVKASQALDMATVNGAKALGRENTGRLAVGMDADIIAIDLDKPWYKPKHDIASMLVYAAQGTDVCMTMVDGRILYENGEYFTIDKEKTYYELEQIRAYVK